MELTDGEFKRVEEIFQKCLPVAWSVDMFNFYLDYIRRMNNVLTGGEHARTTISQAYEFVVSVVGIDKDSGAIWADYLDFVKSSQVHTIKFCILRVTHLNRLMRNGRNNRKWIRRGKFINEPFAFLLKIWKRYGKDIMHLRTISVRQP